MSTIAFIEVVKRAHMIIKILFCLTIFLVIFPITQSFAQSDDRIVILDTKSGRLVIEFFPNEAPNHVKNFINLTESGFYDRTIFHRVIEGFMIQGGDPLTKPGAYETVQQWGTGDPGYKIDAEFNDIKHNRGIVSMARSADPNSAGSQFFIVHKDSNFLDGQYTVFGRLVTQDSYETLEKIATLETAANDIPLHWGEGEILKTSVVKRSTISDLLELGDPERVSESTPTDIPNGKYSNEELGFSISFPTGWLIQEPQKTQPGIPDVTAVAPSSNGLPSISISIGDSNGKTLEELTNERKLSLQTAIDSGQLAIDSEKYSKVGGNDVHIMIVTSNFQTSTGNLMIKFKETVIETPEKFFMITYVNSDENFDKDVPLYDETINSFKTSLEDSQENGGGCLIATASFGTELTPQVQQLRELRDTILLQTESGSAFMNGFNTFYYSFSPTIADWERHNPVFKEAVKILITPLITSLSLLNYVDIDSEVEVLGYGASLILLNIGMYLVAPAYVIFRLRK